MKRCYLALVVALVLGAAVPASAQTTHPCDVAVPVTSTTFSGRPFTAQWCLPSTTIENTVEVPMRVNGFTISVDGGAAADVTVTAATSGVPSTTSKLQFYSVTLSSGVAKGNHTLVVTPWNFKLNPDGTTTTERQLGGALTIPFVASDAAMTGPPPAPTKGRIIR